MNILKCRARYLQIQFDPVMDKKMGFDSKICNKNGLLLLHIEGTGKACRQEIRGNVHELVDVSEDGTPLLHFKMKAQHTDVSLVC